MRQKTASCLLELDALWVFFYGKTLCRKQDSKYGKWIAGVLKLCIIYQRLGGLFFSNLPAGLRRYTKVTRFYKRVCFFCYLLSDGYGFLTSEMDFAIFMFLFFLFYTVVLDRSIPALNHSFRWTYSNQ